VATPSTGRVLHADGVDVVRDGRLLLDAVSLAVRPGEHWALLGPNGAGKSTLLRLLGAVEHPTRGTVDVLGERLGRVDVRALRARIGWVDPTSVAAPWLTLRELVLTGATGTQLPVPRRTVAPAEEARAQRLAELLGIAGLWSRRVQTLSAGERGRALVARALLGEPALLLLDEPGTGLDLGARELLLAGLEQLAAGPPGLASVIVTHHLEELPRTTTHAALLRAGRLVAAGPVQEVLTGERVGAAFGVAVRVERRAGRWTAAAAPPSGLLLSGAAPPPAP